MDDIANMAYNHGRKFYFLLNGTIEYLYRLSVTGLKPSELSEKMHSRSNSKSYKTKTKAEVNKSEQKEFRYCPVAL